VLRILVMFALITPFWSLFDQKASTWVLMAKYMDKPSWFSPSQMQTFNPALVLIIIPLNNFVIYPWLKRRWNLELTALQKMGQGLFVAASSWVVMGSIQMVMDGGTRMHMAWQIIPYVLLTFGEVFVSATGLEFAYSQAPPTMKGAIMSFWLLSVTIGNLWVLLVNATLSTSSVAAAVKSTGLGPDAFLMFLFAGIAFLSALAFRSYSRRYKVVDHYRSSSPAAAPPDAIPAARVVKDSEK
jgi:POT family proton-dependent oligopeptide transporter